MKVSRIAILGVAIFAGGAAALLMGNVTEAPPPVQNIIAAPTIETEDVLVATNDITLGKQIDE